MKNRKVVKGETTRHRTTSESDAKVPSRFYSPVYESVDELKTALKDGVINHDLKLKSWLDVTEVELGRRLSNRASSFLAAVSAQGPGQTDFQYSGNS